MQYLRTNTATRITVGPFLDATDGVTPEIALTVTACLLTLVVDTGGVPTLVLDIAPTASGGSNDMVHITSDAAGYYDLELAAADVNYLGRARLAITDAANHCPVFMEFMILPAVVYDALVLGTDLLQTDVTQLLGTAWLPPNTAGTPDVNAIELGDAPVTATTSVTFAAASTVAYTTGPVGSVTGNVGGSVDSVTGDTKQTADVATLITTVGTAGIGLSNISLPATGLDLILKSSTFALAIADATWDELLAGHVTADTAGLVLNEWQDGGRLDVILDGASTHAAADVITALGSGTEVFGHSYLVAMKRIEVAAGNSRLSGAGSGTEVLTSEDSSLVATNTVDASGNISAIGWV